MLTWACWLIAAYLIGAIPFGFLIGKMRGVDVRTVGSKNIGATNVFRTVGKKWGLIAFACDVLKGFIPTLLASHFSTSTSFLHLPLCVGVATVVGHMLTPYMKFKGGKGVATAFGMLLGLIPALVGTSFAIFAVVFACSHFISLGSCVSSAFLAVAIWIPMPIVHPTLPIQIVMTLLGLFVVVKHKSNIVRLVKGCENKIY